MKPDGMRIAHVALVAALSLNAPAARAGSGDGHGRHDRFAAYRAEHPDPEAEIAVVKLRTATTLAAAQSAASAGNAGDDRAPKIWRVSEPPLELWDGFDYPEMIVIPAGEYTMGSAPDAPHALPDERPRHRVRIGYTFAVGRYSITVAEYARFAADTRHDGGEACFTIERGEYRLRGNRDWRRPGFRQSADGPVGCVNWFDAQAYVAWLSMKTGHAYRLLSEAEYEYVNRAGTLGAYWWGADVGTNHAVCDGCGSAFDNRRPAPAGSFAPNAFALYDTTGNTWSWLADCWNADYAGAPADGSADVGGDCDLHVMRGGSVHSPARELRSAARSRHWFSLRNVPVGFRVARTL